MSRIPPDRLSELIGPIPSVTSRIYGSGYAYITSGSVGGLILSGNIASGQVGFQTYDPRCGKCGVSVLQKPYVTLLNIDLPTINFNVCAECAGFDIGKNDFKRREDWIREELQMDIGTPFEVLADLCEEVSRIADARYLRGKILTA